MPGSAPTHQSPASRKAATPPLAPVFTVSGSFKSHSFDPFFLSPFSTFPFLNTHAVEGLSPSGKVIKPWFVCFPSHRPLPRTFVVQNLNSILRPHYQLGQGPTLSSSHHSLAAFGSASGSELGRSGGAASNSCSPAPAAKLHRRLVGGTSELCSL